MKKICCLVLTYNRKKYLKNELESLIRQTYSVAAIVVVNNASQDDTYNFLVEYLHISDNVGKEKLYQSKYGNKDIFYYEVSKNNGSSGGFRKCIEIANQLDYDYYWIMDDDISPRENCLENVIKRMKNGYEVYIPRREGVNFTDTITIKYRFNNPFVHFIFERSVEPKRIDKETYDVKTFTFEGPIIEKNVLKKVGLPDTRYYYQGDDFDFAFRCLKYTKMLYVCDAIIDRQIPRNNNRTSASMVDYYWSRNMALLDILYCKNWLARFLRPRLLKFKWYFICIKQKNKKRWIYIKNGINDALKGIGGKKEDFFN